MSSSRGGVTINQYSKAYDCISGRSTADGTTAIQHHDQFVSDAEELRPRDGACANAGTPLDPGTIPLEGRPARLR